MGIAVLVVILGYFFASVFIIAVVTILIRKLSPKKSAFIIIFTIFILGWPGWLPIVTWTSFKLACRFGDAGTVVLKPYKLDSFTVARDKSGYPYGPSHIEWGDESESISNCHKYCSKILNNLFRESASPWSFIRNGDIEIGRSWKFKGNNSGIMHGRFWVDQITSEKCLAPLELNNGEASDSQCIAGEEINKPTATYTVIMDYAYEHPKHQIGILKFEHQLRSKEELIARYRWYTWEFLLLNDICPNELQMNHRNGRTWNTKIPKDEMFFKSIYSAQFDKD